jgi:hypothetical protein
MQTHASQFSSSNEFNQISSPYSAGVFTVGSSGQVRVDYLFDGGAYQGEIALFNLVGMEAFNPSSQDFVQEAVRRALSQSDLGYVVIQDHTAAARFSGAMPGEGHFNHGSYLGPRIVSLVPGSQFGLLIVPNSTVQQVWDNPSDATPDVIFSLATVNPDDNLQWGQISDLDGSGHLFALEDIRVHGHSDRDYNDIILH